MCTHTRSSGSRGVLVEIRLSRFSINVNEDSKTYVVVLETKFERGIIQNVLFPDLIKECYKLMLDTEKKGYKPEKGITHDW